MLAKLAEECRSRDGVAEMLREEDDNPTSRLNLGRIEVDPIQALEIQDDVVFEKLAKGR